MAGHEAQWCDCYGMVPVPVALMTDDGDYIIKCLRCGCVTDGSMIMTDLPVTQFVPKPGDIVGLEAIMFGFVTNKKNKSLQKRNVK